MAENAVDITSSQRAQQRLADTMEKIFSAATVRAVYGEPIETERGVAITASEIMAAGGVGFGEGTSSERTGETARPREASSGGGGGGGGTSTGRPVAVIVVGRDGVSVTPIVDVTKIAVAAITVWGSMLLLLLRLRRPSKGK